MAPIKHFSICFCYFLRTRCGRQRYKSEILHRGLFRCSLKTVILIFYVFFYRYVPFISSMYIIYAAEDLSEYDHGTQALLRTFLK